MLLNGLKKLLRVFVFNDADTSVKVTRAITLAMPVTLPNDTVTYAKMQNVSATDKVLGRSTAGAGDVEEIACTVAGRALIDDADASAQRTTLGLVIGTNVQAYDAGLLSIAALTTAADKMIYTTASDVYAAIALTAFARSILDDADAATVRATIGAAIGTNVQAYDATLLSLAALGTAADKLAYTTEVDVWAETALTAAGRALLDDATAADQLTTLGITPIAAMINLLTQGVAAGYKIARGTLTPGSASDTVVTGLATVVATIVSFKGAPTLTHMFVAANIGDQAGSPAAGSIYINSYKPTGVADVTPIVATTPWSAVDWIAIGV